MTEFEAFGEIKNEYKQIQSPLYRNSKGKIGGTYAWAEDVLRMLFNDGVYYDTELRTKFLHSLEIFEAECCPIESLEGMTPQEITNQYGDLLKNYTAQDLIDEFYPIYLERQREEQENAKKESYGRSDYEVVSVKNTKEASKYKDYTDWCVTKAQDHYNNYAGKYGRFYFLLKKGFEDIPKQKGDTYPLDEYGKSMFAVCVDPQGAITYITCRWNHGAEMNDIPEADHVVSPTDLSEIVNLNVYEACKPYSKQELRAMGYVSFDDAQELLDKGEKPEDVFEKVFPFREGFAKVQLNDKYNFIDTKGDIVSDTWFDNVDDFQEGFARVELNDKLNYIDTDGNLLSKTWFECAGDFYKGVARVELNGKGNFIDKNGNYLSKTWFDDIYLFQEGFAKVRLNGKYNFIDTEGNILSKTWFDDIYSFKEGFARVWLNGKWNYIDTEGRLYDKNKQQIAESFTGLQNRIYEAIQIGIMKGMRKF